MDQARKTLEKEVDIIEMIRFRRFVRVALRYLLQPSVRKQLKAQSRFLEVNLDPEAIQAADKAKEQTSQLDVDDSRV